MKTLRDIRTLPAAEVQAELESWGEKAFRIKQVQEWLWTKKARSFSEMSNLSLGLREQLESTFSINPVTVSDAQHAEDGTVKCAFKLADGRIVEGVLIPTPKRMTACISSQVGCSLSCAFCATGKLKRLRNLEAAEMFDQVVLLDNVAKEKFGKGLTNIVYMGMGEPLLNFKNTMRSAELITGDPGLGMAARRITVSTAGIAKMIYNLAEEKVRFNLALSLHAANDAKRSQIMPINEQNSIEALMDSLHHYCDATGNNITFEYILLKDLNDGPEDAAELIKLCRQLPVKVNLIEYNPVDDVPFERTPSDKADAFAEMLNRKGVVAKIRRSRGKDIDAACGQLANKKLSESIS